MRTGRFGCWLEPFWSCFFFHWGRFGQCRFGFSGPFSTFIGAVLAMGRFGRFPVLHSVTVTGNVSMQACINAVLRSVTVTGNVSAQACINAVLHSVTVTGNVSATVLMRCYAPSQSLPRVRAGLY